MEFTFAMQTDVGRVRTGNEDFCAADAERGVFVICDGMGGAAAGEVASRLAAKTFLDHLAAALPLPEATEPLLRAAVRAANAAVFAQAQDASERRGMGTTLVALMLASGVGESTRQLWLTHVGDSRCYRMRAGELAQMTADHSLVQEQMAAGHLTPEQAERSPMRNIITRSIGTNAQVEPDVQMLEPEPGDVYLLASDGLTRELGDAEVAACLGNADNEAVCATLVEAANAVGGRDNVTVLVLRAESRE